MIIAFMGSDGSGKSTLASKVMAQLAAEGADVSHRHWRPRILPGRASVALPQKTHMIRYSKARGSVLSRVTLVYQWLDFLVGVVTHRATHPSRIIIWERYFYDVLVDPGRYRLRSSPWLSRMLAFLLPAPSLCVFLIGSAEAIAARKGELTIREVRDQEVRLLELRNRISATGAMVLDSTQSDVDSCVRAVLDRISSSYAASDAGPDVS